MTDRVIYSFSVLPVAALVSEPHLPEAGLVELLTLRNCKLQGFSSGIRSRGPYGPCIDLYLGRHGVMSGVLAVGDDAGVPGVAVTGGVGAARERRRQSGERQEQVREERADI